MSNNYYLCESYSGLDLLEEFIVIAKKTYTDFDDCKFQVFAENLFYDLSDYTETKYVVLGY